MATLVLVQQSPSVVQHALAGTPTGRIVLVGAAIAFALAAARHVHGCRTSAALGPGDGSR